MGASISLPSYPSRYLNIFFYFFHHIFSHFYAGHVSPHRPVLRLLTQVNIYTVHPPPFQASFSSHPHTSLSLFSRNILHPFTCLFLRYFSHFRCPSNSFNLCNTAHPSQPPHFCHVQLLLLHFLRCPCLIIYIDIRYTAKNYCWHPVINIDTSLQPQNVWVPGS